MQKNILTVQQCEQLFSNLAVNNTIILTPNRRLSTYLLSHYDKVWQQQAMAWQRPAIMPMVSYLNLLYEQAMDYGYADKQLIDSTQQQLLWQQIIEQQQSDNPLLNMQSCVKLAQQAWYTLQYWQVSLTEADLQYNEDATVYNQWACAYEQLLIENNWIDQDQLPQLLNDYIKQGLVPTDQQFMLFGFDDFPPAVNYLLQTLVEQGCGVGQYDINIENSAAHTIAIGDSQQEMLNMARWAVQTAKNNPKARIACIVPNLSSVRHDLVRLFAQVAEGINYNISGGRALADYAIIETAINILRFNINKINMTSVSQVLLSPYIEQGKYQYGHYSQLDLRMRQQYSDPISHTQLQRLLMDHSTILGPCMEEFVACDADNVMQPSDWAQLFCSQLDIMGWPGNRGLDSLEYQLVDHFQTVLNSFTKLDTIYNKINIEQALMLLQQMTKDSLFQAKSDHGQIEVLGILEAAAIPFDHIWLMNMHGDAWPTPAKPNPFIPNNVQVKHNMPHSHAKRESDYCQLLTQRLVDSCHNIIFSYAQFHDDQELLMSPLIDTYKAINLEQLQLAEYQSTEQQQLASADLEYIDDNYGPPLEQGKLSGGTQLFKLQSLCPFRAFAARRLKAEALPENSMGIDKLHQGSSIHELLQSLWSEIGDWHHLQAMNDEQLQQLINQHIHTQQRRYQTDQKVNIFLEVEQQRLQQLLFKWFDYEKQRQAFKVIAVEQQQTANILGLEITMQVDRIDELADGSQIIIDYKTGRPHIASWLGERPTEPQLLLYCNEGDESLQGISFAQVRNDEALFKGITAKSEMLPNVLAIDELEHEDLTDDWTSQVQQWLATLKNLAHEFKQGFSAIAPTHPESCMYCDLHSLCRILEHQEA